MTSPLHIPAIRNLDLRPSQPSPVSGGTTFGYSRKGAGRKGSLGKWYGQKLSRFTEAREREILTGRAADIIGSDPHAASVSDSMATHIVGTGLTPQPSPFFKALGMTEDEAQDLREACRLAWVSWQAEADARGRLPFWMLSLLAVYDYFTHGEFFQQPVMLDGPNRTFSLALQQISPSRVFTPADRQESGSFRDGIEIGPMGQPLRYWVAGVDTKTGKMARNAGDFTPVPAWVGHRPGIFHGMVAKGTDQYRGVSPLAPAMKLFRDLSDYLDFEVVGAIVAASFPVWIETPYPNEMAEQFLDKNEMSQRGEEYQEVAPAGIYYGRSGERPHILSTTRPGNTFEPFVERLLRGIGASVGLPYEVVSKDFSKTNYAGARAALLEAWNLFGLYQQWLVSGYMQPIYEMLMEEAWLRGWIRIKKHWPDWYAARRLYTHCRWIPPRRGHVDPSKEISAIIDAMNSNIMTLGEAIAEVRGGSADWESILEQRGREKAREKEKDLVVERGRKAVVRDGEE